MMKSGLVCVGGLALSAALSTSAMAQTGGSSARASDITGIWTNASLTPLTRPKGIPDLVVSESDAEKVIKAQGGLLNNEDWKDKTYSDPNAPAPEKGGADFGVIGYDSFWTSPGTSLARVKGELRTSNIVDPPNGQIPYKDNGKILAAQAERGRRYATGEHTYEGPEETGLPERCLIGFGNTGGPGMLSILYNNTYQFVQTKDHLMILVEMAHDARIIPLFADAATARASHKPDVIKPWLGTSVGWLEGATVVTETINVRPEQASYGPFWISPTGKVIERYTRINDDEIFYEFIVEDPELYTQTWKGELSFYPSTNVYEYACHEGNYGLPGILAGARAKEAEEGVVAKPAPKKTRS